MRTWLSRAGTGLLLITAIGLHSVLALSWRPENAGLSLWERVARAEELWQGGDLSSLAAVLRGWFEGWLSETPIWCGEHALHWYQARAGIAPWMPTAWDPMVYGGYLITPWWDAPGRLAALWMVAEPSWRAYKLGLLGTVLVLPILWWWAARNAGAGAVTASAAALLGVAAFWTGPGMTALAGGDLDLLAALGLVPWFAGTWCAWETQHRFSCALGTALCLIVLGWAYPLAGISLVVLGGLRFLWVGVKQSGWWMLVTASLGLLVMGSYYPTVRAVYDTWWVLDGRPPERPVFYWASVSNLPTMEILLLLLLASGTLAGCWGWRDRRAWGLCWLACWLAGMCPVLPLPYGWQPARLAGLVVVLAIAPATWQALSLLAGVDNTACNTPGATLRAKGLRVILGLALLVGLGYAVSTSRMLMPEPTAKPPTSPPALGSSNAPPGSQDDSAAQMQMLLQWLEQYTTLDAAIALEEDEDVLRWSPSWIAASGRRFANGLAREVPWPFHEFRLRTRPKPPAERATPVLDQDRVTLLNGKPVAEWSVNELGQLLDQWNIGWILVRRPEVAAAFLRLPQTTVVAQENRFGWRLLARPAPGYFLEGQGRLARVQPGSIALAEVAPVSGRCRLRLAYVPGLVTSCDRCRIEPAYVPGMPFPCWQINCAGPQARLTVRYDCRLATGH